MNISIYPNCFEITLKVFFSDAAFHLMKILKQLVISFVPVSSFVFLGSSHGNNKWIIRTWEVIVNGFVNRKFYKTTKLGFCTTKIFQEFSLFQISRSLNWYVCGFQARRSGQVSQLTRKNRLSRRSQHESCLRSESRVETGSVRKYYFRRKLPHAGMCSLWKCFLECAFPSPTPIMLCSNKRCCVMTSALQNRLSFLPPKFFTFVCVLFSASRAINSF